MCLKMSLDNDKEMNAAKCGNEIRHLFLNYNGQMGKDGGERGGGWGRRRVNTGKLDSNGERTPSSRMWKK